MKTEKNILLAFLLNLAFSIFEFIGGIFTGSIAILSDAVHDIGDAVSVGTSYFLEKKSKNKPDNNYTYGYARFSVLGGVITTFILLFGSCAVVFGAIRRIIAPTEINYDGMIIFAIVGALVNFLAAFFTRDGDSINQRAVNLHMLEDVLGWLAVLVGAIIMRFTDFAILDPILSICVALFILVGAIKNLKEILDLFLEKTPCGLDVNDIAEHVKSIDGVLDVHHIHLRSLDGQSVYATMHIVINGEHHKIKEAVRAELREHGIVHATLELETENEDCHEKHCHVEPAHSHRHRHHHH